MLYLQAMLSNEKLPPLEGILVGGKTLQYSLIQKIKSRERERQRMQRQRSRESSRRSLSLDAPSFFMSLDGGSSSGTGAPGGANGESSSDSHGGNVNEHMPAHRRQLGERLYPKVHALQPVSLLKIYNYQSPHKRKFVHL